VTEYAFEARPLSLLAVNAGYSLIRLTSMGAIVGGSKRRARLQKTSIHSFQYDAHSTIR
jgi:hypothetical protein